MGALSDILFNIRHPVGLLCLISHYQYWCNSTRMMIISMSGLSDPIFSVRSLILAMAGWGGEVFTAYSHWWFVPLLSCHLGAILGAGVYLLLVELHWPRQEPLQHPQHQHHSQASPEVEDENKVNTKLPSLTRPGFGSNFLNVSRKFASMPVTERCRYFISY